MKNRLELIKQAKSKFSFYFTFSKFIFDKLHKVFQAVLRSCRVVFVPFHSDILLMDGSWGSLTPSEPLPRILNIYLFRFPLTDTCSTCSLAVGFLFTYTKLRMKNLRFCAISVPRSMWCLHPWRFPLLGTFLYEGTQFRCLHWGSPQAFKFAPFPEARGKDPTVPCLDDTSAPWVLAVSPSAPGIKWEHRDVPSQDWILSF